MSVITALWNQYNIGSYVDIIGVAISLFIWFRTGKINKRMKAYFSERSFNKARRTYIDRLIENIQYLKATDPVYIYQACQEVDGVLSAILINDLSLNRKTKHKIREMRKWLAKMTKSPNKYTFVGKYMIYNDILSTLVNEEAIYNEQKHE